MLYYVEERKVDWGSKRVLVVMKLPELRIPTMADERGT